MQINTGNKKKSLKISKKRSDSFNRTALDTKLSLISI